VGPKTSVGIARARVNMAVGLRNMPCFCLKSNFLRICVSLEVEDRPKQEEQCRLPESIACEDRQQKHIGWQGETEAARRAR
jgi:hypothetical protein